MIRIEELRIGTVVQNLKNGNKYNISKVELKRGCFHVKFSENSNHAIWENEFNDFKIVSQPIILKRITLIMDEEQFNDFVEYKPQLGIIAIRDRFEKNKSKSGTGSFMYLSVGDEVRSIEVKDVE